MAIAPPDHRQLKVAVRAALTRRLCHDFILLPGTNRRYRASWGTRHTTTGGSGTRSGTARNGE